MNWSDGLSFNEKPHYSHYKVRIKYYSLVGNLIIRRTNYYVRETFFVTQFQSIERYGKEDNLPLMSMVSPPLHLPNLSLLNPIPGEGLSVTVLTRVTPKTVSYSRERPH